MYPASHFKANPLTGHVLIAHPNHCKPHNSKAVVLIQSHSIDDKIIGFCVNKPLSKKAQSYHGGVSSELLNTINIFEGGPHQEHAYVLTSWVWDEDRQCFMIESFIDEEEAESLQDEPNTEVKAYLGHYQWDHGDILEEIENEEWMVAPLAHFAYSGKPDIWLRYIKALREDLMMEAVRPRDFTLN